mgnify:CR=1 FL=1
MNEQHRSSAASPGPGSAGTGPSPGWVTPGLRLGGRFVLLETIGVGGEAVVARARDEQLRTIVAIKLLRSDDDELQDRFVGEAEMLANVQHPAIVRVLAHGRDELPGGSVWYMALELLAGPNLGQRLADALAGGGPLPWRQVVEIGIQIADALDAAHRKGLIHRDVKPGNIMLAEPGDPTRVKLIDFGCARVTESYRDPTGFVPEPRRRTGVGLAIGTPGYLPLEAGLAPADERFDVFGLGATLYQLLTGQRPFEGSNNASLAYQIVHHVPPPPSSLRPEVPPELDAICVTATMVDPARRYATADAMALDVERHPLIYDVSVGVGGRGAHGVMVPRAAAKRREKAMAE